MFSKELEEVIDAAIADGVLTDKERELLKKRADQIGQTITEIIRQGVRIAIGAKA